MPRATPVKPKAPAAKKPTTRNDTRHLLASPVNAKRLVESKAQIAPKATVRSIPAGGLKRLDESVKALPTVQDTELRDRVYGVDSIEDAFRGTGRTLRMASYVAALSRGKHDRFTIVVPTEAVADYLRSRPLFYAESNVVIVVHDPKAMAFSWEDVIENPNGTNNVWVDHAVIYQYLFNAMNKLGWDQQFGAVDAE